MDFLPFYFDNEADVLAFVDSQWSRIFNVEHVDYADFGQHSGWTVRVKRVEKVQPSIRDILPKTA